MSINATANSKEFEVVPSGSHVARVYSVIHIGTIPGEYMGEPKETNTVRIGFELPMETRIFKEGEGERPMTVSREYTVSMSEKANLRHLVEGIVGTALDDDEAASFDVLKLMGETCLLNVQHKKSGKGSTYAKIVSASPVPKGMTVPEANNEPFMLDFNDNWSEPKFEKLSSFVKDKIRTSKEYKALKGISADAPAEPVNPDDVPF